jgi:maltose alpha-D-glucosyltransferase/alpha-amylase
VLYLAPPAVGQPQRSRDMKRLLALVTLLTASVASAQRRPAWLERSTFYQIYPSSFQDSDGNGIGDIAGIRSRLGYLDSLGVNALWLNPVFKSGFGDGGYDVIDFYQVDPRFGTNAGLAAFAKDAHRRGMHVVLDLVAGHTSNQSEWFRQSMRSERNQYSDYYIWPDRKPTDLPERDAARFVEANAPRARYYVKNYYDIQPALNFGYASPNPDHPWEQAVNAPGPLAVRRELQHVISFWMDQGIDGFRVDLAASLVKNDPDRKATIALWRELNAWFDQAYPNGVLIAEWFNPKESLSAHFDVDFLRSTLFTARGRGASASPDSLYFSKAGRGSVAEWVAYFGDQYRSTLHDGYLSLPTGNHDSPRIANGDRTDPQQLKVAMTFLLTQPGIPFIYYGDEIGMRYIPGSPEVEGSRDRSGTRTPMQWDGGPNAGFSTAPASRIYIPQDPDPKRPTVAAQRADPGSQLSYVRELLKLRASSAALGNLGEWEFLSDPKVPYPMVYRRFSGGEQYVVAINPSDRAVQATIPSRHAADARYVAGTTRSSRYTPGPSTDTIDLPAVSAAIFRVR